MLSFAVRNLLSRPVRSLLALLGLTVAIMGMVGLFSVAVGLDHMVNDTFSRIPGVVVMQYGSPLPLFSRVPAAFEEEISKVEGVGVVNPEVWTRVNVIDEKRIVSPPRFLLGTEIESRIALKQGIYRDAVIDGRFLKSEDRGTPHAVISRQIAEEFEVGVGDSLEVNGTPLEIVGIYHCGSLLLDVTIIVDIEFFRSMTNFDPRTVAAFYVEPATGTQSDVLAERIDKALKEFKGPSWSASSSDLTAFGSGGVLTDFFVVLDRFVTALAEPSRMESQSRSDTPAVEVRRAEDWAERFDEFSADLDLFLSILTGIGLTIAVLSIVNTMLMSVTERIVEFGILKANGWSKFDVMKLIGFESAVLGVAGGILGAILGWVGTLIINARWPEHVQLYASGGLLLFAVAFSTLLGLIGGLYPAIWATRMMPMDAIRRG